MYAQERKRIAAGLIGWEAWWIDMAYRMNCVQLKRAEKFFGRVSANLGRIIMPLAIKIDKEAALDRMILEGWWG